MLTMPARSAHRPARPASRIGVATRKVDEMVPDEVMSSASVMMRTIDNTSKPPSQMIIVRREADSDFQ